jgi:hypothetical protein
LLVLRRDAEPHFLAIAGGIEDHVVQRLGGGRLEEDTCAADFEDPIVRARRVHDFKPKGVRRVVGCGLREVDPQASVARGDLVDGIDGALRDREHRAPFERGRSLPSTHLAPPSPRAPAQCHSRYDVAGTNDGRA